MNITRKALREAERVDVLRAGQAEALWAFLTAQTLEAPRFTPAHILYYLGGLLAIGAMTLFMTLGWERFGGWGVFGLALCYGAAGVLLLRHLLYRHRLHIPAGLVGAFVVALIPLGVYGLQAGLGYWQSGLDYRDYHHYVDWRWLFMELATLAGGAVLLWRYRLPFMVAPVAVTLWYMSMDLAPLLLADPAAGDQLAFRRFVSLWFGLAMLLMGFWVDVRSRGGRDYAFWLYLFGLFAFWGALSLFDYESEWAKLGYCAVNVLLLGIGAGLRRRAFAVFGGLGIAGYVGYLAYDVFEDSVLFPFALTAIGLAIVGLGILWQRNEAAIGAALRRALPAPVRRALD